MSFSIKSKKIVSSLLALTLITSATAGAGSNVISKIIPTNSISASAADHVSNDGKWRIEFTSTYTCRVTKYLGNDSTVIVPEAIDSHTVTSFGTGAFKDKGQLVSLTIPRGIASVPTEFCMNCSNLKYMTLSPGVKSIGARSFKNTNSLISFYVPTGLETVGANAFENSNIPSFSFPYAISNTRTIGSKAFLNCHNLSTVSLPGNVRINSQAFSGCEKLINIDTEYSNLTYAFANHGFKGANNLDKLNGFQIWATKAGQPYIHQWIRDYVYPYETTLYNDNVKMYMSYYNALHGIY